MSVVTRTVARTLLTGDEAIARGAYEAGVRVASAYPGTPSTQILEALATFEDVDARWAPNEKVALDVALGASLGGVRALAAMKHVGLNVASDTFMTAASTGVGAGLVIVSADDPGMHSSQNEQDNRFYARFAGVPLLEPADSAEAKAFVRVALELSEAFDTPTLLRITTRIAHTRGPVEESPAEQRPVLGFRRDPAKYVMLPAYARQRRPVVLQRLEKLGAQAERSALTVEELRDPAIGVITAGISYHYVRETLPEASVLKLGMSHPLPLGRIRAFADKVQRLIVVEELEPFLEETLRAAGLRVEGKALFPRIGELDPDVVRDGFARAGVLAQPSAPESPPRTVPRPPVLCAGCPHVAPYLVLRRLDAVVAGDIGCYTLAALEPLSAMDTCVAMGCSIGMATGLAASEGVAGPVVATIGDSTFLHSGIGALMDAVYNEADITVLILDNGTVAMTGGQEHPGTGLNLRGRQTRPVDVVALCRALGVEHVEVVDPYDLGATYRALEAAIAFPGTAVVITNRPCVEAPVKIRDQPFEVLADACIACQACMNLGCPAIVWSEERYEGRRKVVIQTDACTGCALCPQTCITAAIVPAPDHQEASHG